MHTSELGRIGGWFMTTPSNQKTLDGEPIRIRRPTYWSKHQHVKVEQVELQWPLDLRLLVYKTSGVLRY
jgi:hypothetical protein